MGIQRKPRDCLMEVMESQVRGKVPEAVTQAKLPIPHDPQQNISDKKRKREQKGREVAKTNQTKSLGDGAPGDKG